SHRLSRASPGSATRAGDPLSGGSALRLLAPLFSILILSTAAAAASSPDPAAEQRHGAAITDFAGPWIGRTDPGSARVRNATLLIGHFAGDVFRVTWTSFEADPRTEGGVAKRERSLVFRPSSVPGIWIADPSDDPFMLLGAWAR